MSAKDNAEILLEVLVVRIKRVAKDIMHINAPELTIEGAKLLVSQLQSIIVRLEEIGAL